MLDISVITQKISREVMVQMDAEQAGEFVWSIAICRKRTREQVTPFLVIHKETQMRSLDLMFDHGNKPESRVKILPSRTRFIPHPVRGYLCTHYLCFDLEAWVLDRVNKKLADWKCPICYKSCLEFRFDEVQYQLQIQFPCAVELVVSSGLAPFQVAGRAHEPLPVKKPKVEEDIGLKFEDFLNGTGEMGRDENFKRQITVLQTKWAEETQAEEEGKRTTLCYHPSVPSTLAEVPLTIKQICTYIDIDAD